MKSFKQFFSSIILILFLQIPGFGQAPSLGTASDFAVFTAVGAFENLGASSVTGDVGTQAGAFSGFLPGVLVGDIHVADSVSYQAALDVNTAFSEISGMTCGIVLETTMGNNQRLTPNTYCLGAASTLNGNLILDGNGDSNAVFIFKIDGALFVNPFSRMILENSASISHVYWSINGKLTAGESAVLKGTFIVNGAIDFLEGSTLEGRALSREGAISLHNNLIEIKSETQSLLPITLFSFEVEKNETNSGLVLLWATVSEENSAYFLIERSIDGINYKTIGKQNALGVSNQFHSYFFCDCNPNEGLNYYRLNQFDFNGDHAYSPEKAIAFSYQIPAVTIYPNPFTTSINLIVNDSKENLITELKIFDFLGKELVSTKITKSETTVEIGNLPSGIYFYNVISKNRIIQSGKLIAQ
ncbi:MAG: ice-binding family protein [Bacteroidota bacterium]